MRCFRDKIEELKNNNKKVEVVTIKESLIGQLQEIGEDYIVIDKDKIINMNSLIYIKECQERKKPGVGHFDTI